MKSLWNNKGLNLGLQKSQPAPVDDGYLHSPSPYQPNASPTFSAASPLSTSFRGQTPSPQKHTFDDSGMNAFDSMDLPFSPAKQANSKSSARNHDYKRFNGSISSGQDATMHPDLSTTSSAEPSPGALSLFGNSQGRSRHGSERSNASSHTTYPGEDMLMEILSSQAIIESREFEVLSWNDLESLKQEHQFVQNRITALQYKLNLELKMRDATLLMERPGKDPLSAGLDSSSINLKAIKPSALHLSRSDSYQHRMEVASSNIAGVTADLSRLQQQESDLKTKLLRHMAGVLGFVLSKRDEEESEYTTGPPTPCVSSNKNLWRFEGPHLFAANKDAMQPTPLSRSRRGRSATSSRDTSQNISMSNELQQQIDKLQADYTSIQSELQESRQDSESLRSQLENAQDVTSRLQQQYDQLHAESRDLQADRSRESESAARLRSQVAQYESDMHALEDQLQAASANLSALEESTRGEAGALAERLSSVERELQDAIEQKKDVQRQATELEGQLAAERQQSSEKAQQVNKFKTSLNDLAKRNSLAPLPASRSLPGADDHSTMLSWLNTQLSQTRSKAGDLSSAQSQVSSLQRQLAAKDSELQQTKRSLEDATSSVASLQRNVEQQKEHASQSSSLLPKLRDNISSLESKLAAMTSERDASQRQFTDAQNEQGSQKAEAIALQNALQDLWKALPAQREISKPGETDDLSAWKRAYSPAPSSRLPILRSNNASSGSKYSLDALSDRIRTLISDDKQLIDRLIMHESSVHGQNSALSKAQRSLKDKEAELTSAQKEIEDMQAYIEASAAKEAEMLERLNDAQLQAEDVRSAKRKMEASAASSSRIAHLEDALSEAERNAAQMMASEHGRAAQLENQLAAANSEVDELRDAVADLEDELNGSREREQKSRGQLLDEIAELGRTVSSLKSQLRQEQRKAKKGGE